MGGEDTYRPSTSGGLHVAVHLEEPVGGASDLEVVGAALCHLLIPQVLARVALLEWYRDT